jgi:hypothetical protein
MIRNPNYSTADLEFLKAHLDTLSIDELATKLGRSAQSVRCIILRKQLRPKAEHGAKWSSQDTQFLSDSFNKVAISEIAKRLDCTEADVI